MDQILKIDQKSPPMSSPHLHHSSTNTSFPILAIAIIGILTTALLLISYYIFVIKCCLNWHRIDILSRFSLSRTRNHEAQPGSYSPRIQRRGLEESIIQSIPIVQYRKGGKRVFSRDTSFKECSVCLNEFQEEEKLRSIPNCAHLFHVDCIDVWLQRNENCPLCRRSISITISQLGYFQEHRAESSSLERENLMGPDEDYVVIELGNGASIKESMIEVGNKKGRNLNHVASMGDECIDTRGKDNLFVIQPMRRSISMDSANDRQLYVAVQEIIEKNKKGNYECGLMSEGSSSSRLRRSFFSFGSGRGSSRSAVLPIESDP